MHFTQEEILKDLKKEEKHSPWKKPLLILLSLLTLILFLFAFVLDPAALSILGGLLESSRLDENSLTIQKKEVTLSFTLETYKTLKELFIQNEGREFKACVLGTKENVTYNLYRVFVPETYFQEFSKVVAAPCPAETLIDLHSHPLNHCIPSYHDVQVLKALKGKNSEIILGVMCNVGRFNFYL